MKKLIAFILCAYAVGVAAQTMDTRVFTFSNIGTNASSQTFVLRGDLEGVYVDVTATKTQTVKVATSYATALEQSFTADGARFPRVQLHNSAGVAQTAVDSGSNTNAVLGKFPLAGPVTVTVTPAANTTGTNTTTVTVIYKP